MTNQSKNGRTRLFIALMLAPALLFPLVMTYIPMFRGIVMAFQNYKLTNINNVYFNHFKNFKKLFTPSLTKRAVSTNFCRRLPKLTLILNICTLSRAKIMLI